MFANATSYAKSDQTIAIFMEFDKLWSHLVL